MADKLGSLKPQKKIELYSGNYFAACTLGGIIACGPTHTMVTPLDLVRIHIYIAAAPTTLRTRNH
jgi:solute carrier family 25 phosphate transporter 3